MTEEIKKEPVEHPGEILRRDYMHPGNMRITELAYAMRCSVERLASLITGNRDITNDDAVSLANLFSTSAGFWLRLQHDYDVSRLRMRKDAESLRVKHPGELLREHFMYPRRMTTRELAAHLGKDIQSTMRLLRGERDITSGDAYDLATTFGTSKEFWLNLQRDYDLRMKNAPTT
ncbi:HigA family addiction module antitoxin [Thiolapillus sp.]|uniref:HigA family addiction module antitoxin n=1 Tax=Thiolapillus sp. TaxID=2017437 RepID=UPI003AF7189D